MTVKRFVPRGDSPIVMNARDPIDPTWHRFLRQLGADLDELDADFDSHVTTYSAHLAAFPHDGVMVSDAALVTGSNTVAHGLGRAPVGCVVVADDARPVFVYAFRSGAQSVTGTATVELNDDSNGDWQGNFNTSTYTFTAPHAGLYFADCALGFDTVANDVYVYGALICSTFGTLSFGEASGRGDAIRWGSNLIIPLVLNETVYMSASVESGTEGMTVGKDDARLVIRSDETLVVPSYDATNLTIYSARSRTASFWVW